MAEHRELDALDGVKASLTEFLGRGEVVGDATKMGVGEVVGCVLGERSAREVLCNEVVAAKEDKEHDYVEGNGSGSDWDDEGGGPIVVETTTPVRREVVGEGHRQ